MGDDFGVFRDAESRDEYRNLLKRMWLSNVVPAHELLKIVRAIDETPRPLRMDYEHVLNMLNYASLRTAALRTINLLTDTRNRDRQPLTLRHLQSELLRLCSDQHRDELRQRCAAASRRGRELRELVQRAERVRHKILAHDDEAVDESLRLERAEVEALLDWCKSWLDALQPEGGQGYDVQTLSPDDSMPNLMRLIAQASTSLTLPEREHPEMWKYRAREMSEAERARFNQLRREHGFCEVDFEALD